MDLDSQVTTDMHVQDLPSFTAISVSRGFPSCRRALMPHNLSLLSPELYVLQVWGWCADEQTG